MTGVRARASALLMPVFVLGTGAVALAQAPAQAPAPPPPDYSKVEIQASQLAPNVVRFEAVGPALVGNAGILTGPDGAFMVDAQYPQLYEKLTAAIRKAQPDGKVRFLVNTHHHPDHSSGDFNFANSGTTILSRDELREHLATAKTQPPAGGLPLMTYKGPVTLHMNGEDVQLIPVMNAHTDGDTTIYFTKADVLFVGDFYRSIQYPNVDRTNGGSVKGVIAAYDQVLALAKPTTKIVPGHGPVVDKTAIQANKELVMTIRDRVQALVAQGKTQEEVIAAKPLADLDAKVKEVGTTGDRFLGQVYAELKAGR